MPSHCYGNDFVLFSCKQLSSFSEQSGRVWNSEMAYRERCFFSHWQRWLGRKNPSTLNRSRTYDLLAPVVQKTDTAIHRIKKSIRETNCAIQWIVIYLVDSAVDLSNIWRLVISPDAVHWATGDSWELLFILLELTYISSTQTFRKQTTFRDATNAFPAKWRLRNERRNSILMTRYLGSAFDWLRQISQAVLPIRSSTQILVVMRHQYGISSPVSQTSFREETVLS